jgi:hypothetical protein
MTRCHEIDSDCCALFFHLNQDKELVMKGLIGAAVVAGAFMFAGPAAINPALAAAPQVKAQTAGVSDATDFSARRYYRHHYRYGYRPYYYARPYYYRPYPYYTPAPFTFGFGFGPFW